MRRLLLVDDEINLLHALQRAIRQRYSVDQMLLEMYTDPFDALTRCAQVHFDAAISDFRMPQMSGIEFLYALKLATPTTTRMMLTASTERETMMAAINEAEVFRFLAKPWLDGDLHHTISEALDHHDGLNGK